MFSLCKRYELDKIRTNKPLHVEYHRNEEGCKRKFRKNIHKINQRVKEFDGVQRRALSCVQHIS